MQRVKAERAGVLEGLLFCKISSVPSGFCLTEGRPDLMEPKTHLKAILLFSIFNRHPEGCSGWPADALWSCEKKMEKSGKRRFFFPLLPTGSGCCEKAELRKLLVEPHLLSLNSSLSRTVAQQPTAMASLPSRHLSPQTENALKFPHQM